MRIIDLLKKDRILLHANPKDKTEAIDMLVDLQMKSGWISDKERYRELILEREVMHSTAIEDGIAIPHAKSEVVKQACLSAMTVDNGVDYESEDGKKSTLFFMIAAPKEGELHLEVLSVLLTLLMDHSFCDDLLNANTEEDFLTIISNYEDKRLVGEHVSTKQTYNYQVLAVTACPTGIAHTYMAAEALERAGAKMDVSIKVETNGSGGAKNILTTEEIATCDGIIVAADKSVDMPRFDGKKVLITKVSDGIRKPEELIRRVQTGDVPIYHAKETDSGRQSTSYEGVGRSFYKHLMNGVSNMLPFTVAGGIFIALAFLIDSFAGAPQNDSFGTYTRAAAFFKTIGGGAFNFMIPVLAAYIAKSIADRPGFLVGLVGGYLATTGATFSSVGGDIPSGFLGALLAGFAGGYLMKQMARIAEKIPSAFDGIKPVLLYPLFGLLMIALVMCAVNPFMGVINTGVSNFLDSMGGSSKIVLGCILGAMMSIDMGGPFNKAAYVFGTASIAAGNYDVMAAVMIGGMVPPLAIALATSFFPNRWNAEECKNGPVNYILGLSFITEGAIPYAAADPLRVIPACMVGSAIAGGLSMAFRCTLMAPHGGIFVFAVVGNWLMYLLALAAGAFSGMLLLALLKQKKA